MSAVSRAHRGWTALRRARAVARIRLSARLAGADLDLRVAPTATVGRIVVRVEPGTSGALHVGEHTTVDDGVEIRLRGGSVRIADWVEVRSGVRMMAAGDIDVHGRNLLSWGVVLHCDDEIALGRQAVLSEYVTITDSVHRHVEDGWHLDHLETAPVRVGVDTWVGAKATITRGVTVGDHCVVAGSAVVVDDVPDHHVARGVPASARRREPS